MRMVMQRKLEHEQGLLRGSMMERGYGWLVCMCTGLMSKVRDGLGKRRRVHNVISAQWQRGRRGWGHLLHLHRRFVDSGCLGCQYACQLSAALDGWLSSQAGGRRQRTSNTVACAFQEYKCCSLVSLGSQ